MSGETDEAKGRVKKATDDIADKARDTVRKK